jgi:hypothetical protein
MGRWPETAERSFSWDSSLKLMGACGTAAPSQATNARAIRRHKDLGGILRYMSKTGVDSR